MVIWLTGLSGAGKSTIAADFIKIVKPKLSSLVLIDGDVVRNLFGGDLTYAEGDRQKQIVRIQKIAKFLNEQSIPVIVTALYSNPELLQWNRENLEGYYEVYVNTPFRTVVERDVKGIYQSLGTAIKPNIVGYDIPWQEPKFSDLIIETVDSEPYACSQKIINSVPGLMKLINL